MASLYMENTQVLAERTVSEICAVLVAAGALQINQQYENKRIIGVRWTIRVEGQEVPFAMPARIDPVFKVLESRLSPRTRWKADKQKLREQAERVAWRQLLRWIQAQLALIETGMVQSAEVFMPYVAVGDRTLYEQISERKFAGLLPTAGGGRA